MSQGKGWIGVDLDGTLAHYTTFKGELHIGPPVPEMVARVRRWLAEGREVRIFTARVSEINPLRDRSTIPEIVSGIQDWSQQHVGARLPVTNIKDYQMVELWDDRAVHVIPNTGRPGVPDAYRRCPTHRTTMIDFCPHCD